MNKETDYFEQVEGFPDNKFFIKLQPKDSLSLLPLFPNFNLKGKISIF